MEKAAMAILRRGLRDEKNPRRTPTPATAEGLRQAHTGEIILPESYTPEEIEHMQGELLYYRRLAAERQAELLEIQKAESLGNIEEHHRSKQIRGYLEQIERLNLSTPGGLRSQPVAEAGEDQELVNEAWNVFCARRRSGGSRFG